MEFQLALDTLSRFVHVGTAIVLVGGTAFMRLVLAPSAAAIPNEAHEQLRAGVLRRWKRFVHGGIALFLISGLYNYMRLMPSHKGDGLWHGLVGTKILIALAIFFLASALVGSSATFEPLRQKRPKWLLVMIVLSTVVVGISSFVKVRGPKSTPAAASRP